MVPSEPSRRGSGPDLPHPEFTRTGGGKPGRVCLLWSSSPSSFLPSVAPCPPTVAPPTPANPPQRGGRRGDDRILGNWTRYSLALTHAPSPALLEIPGSFCASSHAHNSHAGAGAAPPPLRQRRQCRPAASAASPPRLRQHRPSAIASPPCKSSQYLIFSVADLLLAALPVVMYL
ncbi:hypothetical protein ABZP36_018513 [Zizania latifolia]